ncbi:MAG: CRTAC1 family protein [Acidobacteriota bacterium]
MTPRQLLLRRYGGSAAILVLAIVAAVLLGERIRQPPGGSTTGIDDMLARDLPSDAPAVYFIDATAKAGIDFHHFPGVRSHRLPEDMGSGLAWGDCDGDRWPDLYIVNFAGPLTLPASERSALPGNALYRNRGDGSFEEVGAGGGVDLKAFGLGAAWGDYDGDGDFDLYVTNYGPNTLFRNDGDCRFTDVTDTAAVGGSDFSAGATWGDYDGDGDLDLYVANYVDFVDVKELPATTSRQYGRAVPYTLNPASYDPSPNLLFLNEGDGHFHDVASGAGVADPTGRSLSAAWCDWDSDGDLDLYVANDISDNAFYRNRGDGTFEDISSESLTADYRGAMGLAVADYDRDGDLDFFVTHWIAQENALYESHLVGGEGPEDLLFTDVADLVGLGATALDFVGWGTAFIDYDNDGRKDLFVANGHTFEDEADPTRLIPQRLQLFWNRGKEGFFDLSSAAGPPFDRLMVARGAAAADFDGDGDIDLAVLAHGGPVVLLANSGNPSNHWLEVDLSQPGANVHAVGATITVEAGSGNQLHSVGSSPSYLSQNFLTAHFGLGSDTVVDRLTVRWPDGAREAWGDRVADRRYLLVRGQGDSRSR